MFAEKDIDRILAEVEECSKAWPLHLIRLIGYDNLKQSLGACVVIRRPDTKER
jgi:ribulose-bisphosphate carboxylase small chain